MAALNFSPQPPVSLAEEDITQSDAVADIKQEAADVRQETRSTQASDNPIPQFKDNPMAAIGLILREVGASLKGKESPIARLQQRHAENQRLKWNKPRWVSLPWNKA